MPIDYDANNQCLKLTNEQNDSDSPINRLFKELLATISLSKIIKLELRNVRFTQDVLLALCNINTLDTLIIHNCSYGVWELNSSMVVSLVKANPNLVTLVVSNIKLTDLNTFSDLRFFSRLRQLLCLHLIDCRLSLLNLDRLERQLFCAQNCLILDLTITKSNITDLTPQRFKGFCNTIFKQLPNLHRLNLIGNFDFNQVSRAEELACANELQVDAIKKLLNVENVAFIDPASLNDSDFPEGLNSGDGYRERFPILSNSVCDTVWVGDVQARKNSSTRAALECILFVMQLLKKLANEHRKTLSDEVWRLIFEFLAAAYTGTFNNADWLPPYSSTALSIRQLFTERPGRPRTHLVTHTLTIRQNQELVTKLRQHAEQLPSYLRALLNFLIRHDNRNQNDTQMSRITEMPRSALELCKMIYDYVNNVAETSHPMIPKLKAIFAVAPIGEEVNLVNWGCWDNGGCWDNWVSRVDQLLQGLSDILSGSHPTAESLPGAYLSFDIDNWLDNQVNELAPQMMQRLRNGQVIIVNGRKYTVLMTFGVPTQQNPQGIEAIAYPRLQGG